MESTVSIQFSSFFSQYFIIIIVTLLEILMCYYYYYQSDIPLCSFRDDENVYHLIFEYTRLFLYTSSRMFCLNKDLSHNLKVFYQYVLRR